MLDLITRISSGYNTYMTHLARQHTLQVLSQQSDATLRDIGVSRELLNGGVISWPWQSQESLSRQCSQAGSQQFSPSSEIQGSEIQGSEIQGAAPQTSERPVAASASIISRSRTTYHRVMSKARAIRELRSFSDRELRDLGITRDCIAEAVNYGRSGIEQTVGSTATATGHTSVAKPQYSVRIENKAVSTLPVKLMNQHTDDRQAA